jgi:hypothetical protein
VLTPGSEIGLIAGLAGPPVPPMGRTTGVLLFDFTLLLTTLRFGNPIVMIDGIMRDKQPARVSRHEGAHIHKCGYL